MVSGLGHRGLKFDPGRIEIRWEPLMNLICLAYDVDPSQISGPNWLIHCEGLDCHIFDIQANLPKGTSKTQVPEMLRGLLAERFKLVAHREMKQEVVYALVIGDKGAKLKEAVPGPGAPVTAPPNSKVVGDWGLSDERHVTGFRVGTTDTTFLTGPDLDVKVTGEASPRPGAIDHIEATKASMSWLARRLRGVCGVRVVDMTGLAGIYQMTIDLPRADSSAPIGAVTGAISRLGLRLEKREAPVDFLVVDRIQKTPTEN